MCDIAALSRNTFSSYTILNGPNHLHALEGLELVGFLDLIKLSRTSFIDVGTMAYRKSEKYAYQEHLPHSTLLSQQDQFRSCFPSLKPLCKGAGR